MSKIKRRKNIMGEYIGEPKYKKDDKVVTTLTGNDVLTIAEGAFHNGMCYMYRFEESEMGCGENYISLAPIKPATNACNELKCTPGEWVVNERMPSRLGVLVNHENPALMDSVCVLFGDGTLDEIKSNAHLIAASKDLYEALREIFDYTSLQNELKEYPELYPMALKALKKANPNYKP